MATITLDTERTDYCGGETVRGVCRLANEVPLPIRGVRVRLHGWEYAFWKESSGRHRHTHAETLDVVDLEQTLFGHPPLGAGETLGDVLHGLLSNDRYLTLPVGTHEYPFEFVLPSPLPGDYEGRRSVRIAYEVRAWVDLPLKADLEAVQKLTLWEPQAPNDGPAVSKTRQNSFLFDTDAVDLTVTLDRDVVPAGGQLAGEVAVEARTSREIRGITVELREYVTLGSGKDSTSHFESTPLARFESPIQGAVRLPIVVSIPADAYASSISSRLVTWRYEIVVSLDIPWALDPCVTFPIRIVEAPQRPSGKTPGAR